MAMGRSARSRPFARHIHIRGAHGAFYFPVTTCILISVVLSLLWWLLNR
jgi:hypothetical protein